MSNPYLIPMLSSQLRELGNSHANELRNKEKEKLVKSIYDNVLITAKNYTNRSIYVHKIEATIIETFDDYEKCIQRYQTDIEFIPDDYVKYQFGTIRGTLSKDFVQDVISDLRKLFPDSLISHEYSFGKYKKNSIKDWETITTLNYDDDKSKFDQVIRENIDDDNIISIVRNICVDWSKVRE